MAFSPYIAAGVILSELFWQLCHSVVRGGDAACFPLYFSGPWRPGRKKPCFCHQAESIWLQAPREQMQENRKLLLWVPFLFVLIFIPMSSKSGRVSSIRWLCWIVFWAIRKLWSLVSFSQCTYCPRRSCVKDSSSDPSALRFWLKCHPWKGQGCQSLGFLHTSAEEELKVFYSLKPGITLPFTSQMQLLEASKKPENIFCPAFPLLTAFPSSALTVPASVGWRGCLKSWVLMLFLSGSWQKPGSFQHSVRERDSKLESLNMHVSVCRHHSSSILPALELPWGDPVSQSHSLQTSLLQTFQFRVSFWYHFTSEVVLRTDKPGTFVFYPQGNLRYSMT